jgi:hypothetical protein
VNFTAQRYTNHFDSAENSEGPRQFTQIPAIQLFARKQHLPEFSVSFQAAHFSGIKFPAEWSCYMKV